MSPEERIDAVISEALFQSLISAGLAVVFAICSVAGRHTFDDHRIMGIGAVLFVVLASAYALHARGLRKRAEDYLGAFETETNPVGEESS